MLLDGRFDAGCLAHARRKFDELFKANASPVAAQAIQRIAWLYRVEADARDLTTEQRLAVRQLRSRPLCEELHLWLQLERRRVPDGSGIAKAIDYSLNRWTALTRFLIDGDVPIDNNHLENQMRPWAVGRRNWLFVGSELAGERAPAIGASLLHSTPAAADLELSTAAAGAGLLALGIAATARALRQPLRSGWCGKGGTETGVLQA